MSDKVYTVSQINTYIRYLIESDEYLSDVRIIGEVSNLYLPKQRNRHVYFTLKDENSKIKCIIFSNFLNFLNVSPQNGMKVVVEGRIGVYEKTGEYSVYVNQICPQGVGELNKAFELLKKKLEKEGLFAQERKRTLPLLPKKIGIITSIEGAAIKDIIKNALKRFPDLSFVIFPVHVQGVKASLEIVRAFEIIRENDFGLDFIVIARGGGSIEELWPFNEEIVARAIYSSPLPVVSAVGHERDVTISDLVSDLRVSTPSMVAESTIPEKRELINKIFILLKIMKSSLERKISQKLLFLTHFLKNPFFLRPEEEIVKSRGNDVIILINRIRTSTVQLYEKRKEKVTEIIRRLSALNPLNILERGYTITYKFPEEVPVRSVKDLKQNDMIKTIFKDGEVFSRIGIRE